MANYLSTGGVRAIVCLLSYNGLPEKRGFGLFTALHKGHFSHDQQQSSSSVWYLMSRYRYTDTIHVIKALVWLFLCEPMMAVLCWVTARWCLTWYLKAQGRWLDLRWWFSGFSAVRNLRRRRQTKVDKCIPLLLLWLWSPTALLGINAPWRDHQY